MESGFTEILTYIGAGGGFAGIASIIISFFKAKSEKTSLDADNFKKFFDESQERYEDEIKRAKEDIELAKKEREQARKNSEEYRDKMDKKISELESTINSMKDRSTKQIRALNSAYRCKLPQKMTDCPVIKTLDEICDGDEECKNN